DPCAIYERAGECIMPSEGLFMRVIEGGEVRTGDEIAVTDRVPREVIQAAVLTVSDRAAEGEREDRAGPALGKLLSERLGAHVAATAIVPDERPDIVEALRELCERGGLDLIVTSGGTGFSPRDVTPEATAEVVERHTPGLDEAMRAASLKLTPHGILSRGRSGICGRTLIVNVPGSPKAACENLEAIVPALPHAIEAVRGSLVDCAPAAGAAREQR
ncbi:MAG: molybdenum cofactor synthesis domain-containing protein, partial [Armatimonadota bacterium]